MEDLHFLLFIFRKKEAGKRRAVLPRNSPEKGNTGWRYPSLTGGAGCGPFLPEIGTLHPMLAISKYMGKPDVYAHDRDAVLQLSEFFWRDEKFLENGKGRGILSFKGLDETLLNCYYAPEPFFCCRTGPAGMVLVMENKDSWFSLGRALKRQGAGLFCGRSVALLIYGEGNKGTRDHALTCFFREDGIGPETEIGYAGNIDSGSSPVFMRLEWVIMEKFTSISHIDS